MIFVLYESRYPHPQDIGIGSMASMCTENCSSQHHFSNHPYIYTNKNTPPIYVRCSSNIPQHLEGGTPIRKRLYLLISTNTKTPPGKGTQKGSRKKILYFLKFDGTVAPFPLTSVQKFGRDSCYTRIKCAPAI